jgi:hypothetical protein
MAMLGQAALVLFFDVAPDVRTELAHWHAHEHFPERLAIPGFLRGTRWTAEDGGEGFLVIYELQDHAVLGSAPYVARLNAPSAWSTRMMPLHRQMIRTQCRVVHSRGAVTARHALTIRCSPTEAGAEALQRRFQEMAETIVQRPGLVGLHLLRHDAPALAPTTEQQIRGHADRAADWVIVACGYDLGALRDLESAEWGDSALQALCKASGKAPGNAPGDSAGSAAGSAAGPARHFHSLAYSATPIDVH